MGEESRNWWKETVVYQIYPRSFADADGDGVGDLEGIISKLDYLKDLGIETVWFSPFYKSPQADFGYDISDYRSVSEDYGDLDTCRRLIDEMHARDMRVVFDMVLNHTSDKHPWFLESRSSRDNPKRDWYIWRDGRKPKGKQAPNNWHSMIGGSGWHYDETTEQWYWAQFLPFQPDLNYRNPEVREEMLATIRFWMDRGVDGFRLDIVNALFEDAEFRDNPFAWTLIPSDDDPTMLFQGSAHTLNHPDTLAFMKVLRQTVDGHDEQQRFMVGEVNAPIEMVRSHLGDQADGLHLAFQFRSLTTPLKAEKMRLLIHEYETVFPEPYLPTWVFSNHDRARRISRIGDSIAKAKLNAAWQLTARGVPFIYCGEEIGMPQARIPARESRDPLVLRMKWMPQIVYDAVRMVTGESVNRDESRTPMQWSPGANAGFCPEGRAPWLPTPLKTRGRSVAEQKDDKNSLLHCYKRFLAARSAHPALKRGNLTLIPAERTGRHVVGYRRETEEERLIVLLNASAGASELSLDDGEWEMVVSTRHEAEGPENGIYRLAAWEGVILKAVAHKE